MTDKDIIQIAAMNGWKASVREKTDGTKYVSFRRYMRSGMPFVFTVEVKDGRADSNIIGGCNRPGNLCPGMDGKVRRSAAVHVQPGSGGYGRHTDGDMAACLRFP